MSINQNFPSIRPSLNLNFARSKKLDSRITFTRGSTGTYVDDNGLIRTAGINQPRFDHDPTSLKSLGLLIEEARTNLASYSTYDVTNWIKYEVPGTATLTTGIDAPDGSTNAVRLTCNNDGNVVFRIVFPLFTPNGTDTYTTSFYVRKISGTGNAFTDFADGAPSANYSSQLITNQWVRVVTSGIPTATSKNFIDLFSDQNTNYVLDFWGVQVEKGSFATSYIPTSGSTVTRNKDIAVIKGTNFTDVFDTNFREFSLLVDYDNSKTNDGTYYEIINFWGESTGFNDRISITKDDQSPYHIETRAFGGGGGVFNNGNLSASSKAATQKLATSWSVPDYSNTSSRRWAFSFNGESVDVVNDGGGTTVPAITRLGLGINPTRLVETETGGLIHFKRFAVYNKALTDAQLQSLTRQ